MADPTLPTYKDLLWPTLNSLAEELGGSVTGAGVPVSVPFGPGASVTTGMFPSGIGPS